MIPGGMTVLKGVKGILDLTVLGFTTRAGLGGGFCTGAEEVEDICTGAEVALLVAVMAGLLILQ